MLGGLFTHVGHSSASQLLTDFTCQKRFEPGLLLDYGQKLNGAKGVQPLFTCKPVWHATRAGLPHARDKSGCSGSAHWCWDGILPLDGDANRFVEWIRSSMDHWTKTKSRIWYGNHILILGWSEKTLYLLNELFEALCSNGDTVPVVILADREQSLMQQEVQQHFYQLWERNSFFDRRWRLLKSVMLREGVAHETDALERAGASMAQEIIILSRDGNPRIADLETVRIMLALSSLREPARCRIFAEAQAHEVETVLRRLHPDPKVIQARAACNHILALLASDQMVGSCLVARSFMEEAQE
ncbi:unnamed protein product [Durusdinium trenchii]|uniref:Uncharacterized protein n=1 Tax=Durusdinium trenchii TaxID=1381693 RepID=A0ABP0J578_9DINO